MTAELWRSADSPQTRATNRRARLSQWRYTWSLTLESPMHYLQRSILLMLGIATSSRVAPSQPPSAIVDSAFSLIRALSVHRDRVNWVDVERTFRSRLGEAATLDDSLSAFSGVFGSLDDVHSAVYRGERRFSYFRAVSAAEASAVAPLITRANEVRGKVESRLIGRDVGYLMIPTIYAGANDLARSAGDIREAMCALVDAGASHWVIDLRLNMGGNMHPMLTGLGPLIGDGDVGGIVDLAGRSTARWSIRGGVNHVNGVPIVDIAAPRCTVSTEQPIAVLVGRVTMSSGQIVAAALAGRPRTRSFGTMTADGYTTANQWIQLSGDVVLNLAVGFIADRRGRVYKRLLEPDEQVAGNHRFDDPPADPIVRRAIDWLKSL